MRSGKDNLTKAWVQIVLTWGCHPLGHATHSLQVEGVLLNPLPRPGQPPTEPLQPAVSVSWGMRGPAGGGGGSVSLQDAQSHVGLALPASQCDVPKEKTPSGSQEHVALRTHLFWYRPAASQTLGPQQLSPGVGPTLLLRHNFCMGD